MHLSRESVGCAGHVVSESAEKVYRSVGLF